MIYLMPITGEVLLIFFMVFQMDLLSVVTLVNVLFQAVMQSPLFSYGLSIARFHFASG